MSLPVVFRCPICAGAFRVQPSPAAQQVRCAHCRGVVLVPATPAETLSAVSSAQAPGSAASPAQAQPAATQPAATQANSTSARAPQSVDPAAAAPNESQTVEKRAVERRAVEQSAAEQAAVEQAAVQKRSAEPHPVRSGRRGAATLNRSLAAAESIPLDAEELPTRAAWAASSAAAPAEELAAASPSGAERGLLDDLLGGPSTAESAGRVASPGGAKLIEVAPLSTSNAELSMQEVLAYGRSLRVSDIHVAAGSPVMLRMARRLVPITTAPLTSSQAERLSLELLSDYQRGILRERRDFDLMAVDDFGRYRVNVGYFDGELGTVIRILSQRPKTLTELQLPEVIRQFTMATKGLVLITGSASQGKTTTMTAMIDEINGREARHIITIEDPIEYQHANRKGLVRQRQIGMDTQDFSSGLRAALRQNPDVISIGEMRDYETIKIALTAAETGCLVISTLHILSIDKIIERLLSFAPAEDEGFVRYVLADTLVGVVHQELLPTLDGGKRVACEVLVCTPATRNIIRNRGTYFLRSVISTGRRFGMVPMQSSVQQLLDDGLIAQETATNVMVNYQ